MGASNVAAVGLSWGRLDLAPRWLLTHMALTSLDPPGRNDVPPCLYWGGWELQAGWMNYPATLASARKLRRLRAQLLTAGAIELDAKGTRAHSTRWLVNPLPLDPSPSPALPWLKGGHGGPT